MANEQNGREFTEQDIRERAAAFDQQFGNNAVGFLNRKPAYDVDLVERTNQMLHRAGDRVESDRAIERIEQQEIRERFAAGGGWVPGNPTEAQRQQYRSDYERRQEWNGLIESGTVTANPQERSIQDLKPPAEMTKAEIVLEARELHAHFSDLATRFEQMAPGPEKTQIRDEMKPLVMRENELREEYTGRVKAEVSREVSQDRVPEVSIGYGR